MRLGDLPSDELLLVTRHLDLADVIMLSSASKGLCSRLQQDEAWEHRIAAWLQQQDSRCGRQSATPAEVKAEFGLTQFRSTYQALVRLGAWPAGLWWAGEGDEWEPRGGLVLVEWIHGFGFELERAVVGIDATRPWPHRRAAFLADRAQIGCISVHRQASTWHAEAAEIKMQRPGEFSRALQGTWEADRMDLVAPIQLAMLRAAVPLTSTPPAPASGGGAQLLHALQGIFAASYAGHGIEVLRLSLAGPSQAPPPGCSIKGLRLEALKLTGDPNVPAAKHSFVVSAGEYHGSPYPDPFPLEHHAARPLVAFPAAAEAEFVDLGARPVAAIFPVALGQINRVPGIWQPEWEPAALVVYTDTSLFSLVFEQPGEQFRAFKDFFPLPQEEKFF